MKKTLFLFSVCAISLCVLLISCNKTPPTPISFAGDWSLKSMKSATYSLDSPDYPKYPNPSDFNKLSLSPDGLYTFYNNDTVVEFGSYSINYLNNSGIDYSYGDIYFSPDENSGTVKFNIERDRINIFDTSTAKPNTMRIDAFQNESYYSAFFERL